MPEMATNTQWFPVMELSMSGETMRIPPGGGGGGQSPPPPIRTSAIVRDGAVGIGAHASNGTTSARNGKNGAQVVLQAHGQGWSAPAPPNPDRMLYRGVGADKRRKERRALQKISLHTSSP